MPDALKEAPFLVIFLFFFIVVFFRTQATYWLARVVAFQTLSKMTPKNALMAKAQLWSQRESVLRGTDILHRWGIIAVPLSFCAFGTKTIVNAAAGLTQMPFGKYCAAMIFGCLIHATIYATLGAAAWNAAVSAAAGSPWGVAALLSLIAGIISAIILARRRQRKGKTVVR